MLVIYPAGSCGLRMRQRADALEAAIADFNIAASCLQTPSHWSVVETRATFVIMEGRLLRIIMLPANPFRRLDVVTVAVAESRLSALGRALRKSRR